MYGEKIPSQIIFFIVGGILPEFAPKTAYENKS